MIQVIDRFVREREVRHLTGLSRATRWRLARRGEFPKAYRLSQNIVAWRLSEITTWMQAKSAPQRTAVNATAPVIAGAGDAQ